MTDACARWQQGGGTHATVVTTWMGLGPLDAHLDYAEQVLSVLRRLASA